MLTDETAMQVVSLLKKYRFNVTDEKALQVQIHEVLLNDGGFQVEREYALDNDRKSIIDFLIDNTGIEVKIKGSKLSIYKQVERYCSYEKIKNIVLVTNVATGFPPEINGKNCYLVNLGKAWL